jgi:hypothetical protein
MTDLGGRTSEAFAVSAMVCELSGFGVVGRCKGDLLLLRLESEVPLSR